MTRYLLVGGWVFSAVLASGTAQAALQFRQEVSQSALWPGDRFRYSITVMVPVGVHVAVEDFDRKNINFAPFVLNDTARETTTLPSGALRYRFDYLLSNYEIGTKNVELPRIIFRYQPVAEAGSPRPTTTEMAIPALPMAVRSTLNQPLSESWIAESLAMAPLGKPLWMLIGLGVVGLLVSSIPAWSWARSQAAQWKARRAQPTRQEFLTQWAQSLDELERVDTGVDVKARFLSLERHARDYVRHAWKLSAAGWTPEQLRVRLDALQVSPQIREVLETTVDHAQHCRYAPDDPAAWEERFRQDLNSLRTLAA